jgi:chromosome segregation ATPase
MVRKIIYGAATMAAVGVMVFGKDAVSYCRTGYTSVRSAVRSEVPLEFEIERARQETQQLVPEIKKSLHVIAREQVEVAHLAANIERKAAALGNQEEAILSLSSDLKSEKVQFVYAGSKYSKKELEKDLTQRFNRFKVAEDTLKKERELLDAKEQALSSHRETLEGMLSQKKDLEVSLERLQARLRTLEARKTVASLSIDDSKLAQVKSLISEIDSRLDVEDAVLNAEGNFSDLIPVEKYAEENIDITAQVDAHFHAPAQDPTQVAQTVE